MIKDNILSWLNWLKIFFVHGDFENAPDDFDILEEIVESISKRENIIANENENTQAKEEGGKGKIKPPKGTETPSPPKFEDPILNDAYQFGKEDNFLKLIRDTLWEIREFERELDDSFEKLNNKFDKQEYQYDSQDSK